MQASNRLKKQRSQIEVRLSPEGTAKTDGAKLGTESMKFGRAVGFSMEDGRLMLTIDERHTGKKTAFDVLEEMMKLLHTSIKEAAVTDSV